MASTAWIDSAAHERKPAIGTGMEGNYQHTLVMARADEEYEAHERVLASRAVQRWAGKAAAEVLAILGLTDQPADEQPPGKPCSTCQKRQPTTEFYPRPSAGDGLCSQCKTCHAATKRRSAARRREAAAA
jgi:hypothetical protein